MFQRADENEKKCTERQVARAEEVHAVHTKIGCPSPADHRNLIKNCLVYNCTVTIEDVKIMEKIFGPNVHALKGKTVRHQPDAVESDCIEVPHDILVLTGDVFFLQGHPFLVALLCVIEFNAVKDSFDMTTKNLEAELERDFNLCS